MTINVEKMVLEEKGLKVHAFAFIPEESKLTNVQALFTHGYTAHKGDLITWASKLVELGIAVTLFDLPGHLLGSFEMVESFPQFSDNAHRFFARAHVRTCEIMGRIRNTAAPTRLILGGHSLGGLVAIKALAIEIAHAQLGVGRNVPIIAVI